MQPILTHTLKLYTTPSQLLKLSIKAEEKYNNTKWGENLVFESYFINGVKIEFIIDQEQIRIDEMLNNIK